MKNTVERIYVEAIEEALKAIKLPSNQRQINGVSNREYTKVNQLILVSAQAENQFNQGIWYSKDQLEEAGLTVKKDAQPTMLFSSKIKEDESRTYTDKESGEIKPFKIKTYRYYYVYNKSQLTEKAQ